MKLVTHPWRGVKKLSGSNFGKAHGKSYSIPRNSSQYAANTHLSFIGFVNKQKTSHLSAGMKYYIKTHSFNQSVTYFRKHYNVEQHWIRNIASKAACWQKMSAMGGAQIYKNV